MGARAVVFLVVLALSAAPASAQVIPIPPYDSPERWPHARRLFDELAARDREGVDRCLQRAGLFEATVRVELVVMPDGRGLARVERVDPSLARCVEERIRAWRFPATERGGHEIFFTTLRRRGAPGRRSND